MTYKAKTNQKARQHEKEYVEDPFLQQLETLGWTIYRKEPPGLRSSKKDVLLDCEFRNRLKAINDWLDEGQVEQAVSKLTTGLPNALIDANEYALDLLIHGSSVIGHQSKGQSTNPHIDYIDYDDQPETRNPFLAISQFQLDVPGSDTPCFLDIALFVNGLPFVVVECKSPKINAPVYEAIDQFNMYRNAGEEDEIAVLVNSTQLLYNLIRTEISQSGF